MRPRLLAAGLVLLMTFGAHSAPAHARRAPAADFEGDWEISNYEERGTTTHKFDGRAVRISRRGQLYDVATPDPLFYDNTRYRLSGNKLVGEYIPDEDEMFERFKNTPRSVLRQAAASRAVIVRTTLAMQSDGRIKVEFDNVMIYWTGDSEQFDHVERFKGFIKFVLTRN